MIPIVYASTETAFKTRGYGALADCLTCTVTEELNGQYVLTMKYPKNGIHSEHLKVRNIIVCQPNMSVERDAFRIVKVNHSLRDNITVTAYHLSYDLSGFLASPYRRGTVTAEYGLNLRASAPSGAIITLMPNGTTFDILESQNISGTTWYRVRLSDNTTGWCQGTGNVTDSRGNYPCTADSLADAILLLNRSARNFEISTDKSSSANFTLNMPSSVRSWFGGKQGSLIDRYGGEWSYHMWDCVLNSHRGQDNGVRISYGVNLAEYQKENEDNMYSHVIAYYAREAEGSTVIKYSSAVATGATEIYRVLLYNATEYYGDTVPTKAQLDAFATSYATANHAKLVMDAQTIAVAPELVATVSVEMGDTVHVIYKDNLLATRVVKTVWNVLSDKYDSIELGTVKTSIAETIKSLSETVNEPQQTIVSDVLAGSTSVVVDKIAKLGTVATLSHTDASNVLNLTDSKKWSTDSVTGGQIFNYVGNLSGNGSKTYTVGNGHRGLIVLQRGSVSDVGLYAVTTSTAGAVYIAPIKAANYVTITTSTNSFTLTNSSSSNYYVSFIGSSKIS